MSMSHRIIALAVVPIPALGESELSSSIFFNLDSIPIPDLDGIQVHLCAGRFLGVRVLPNRVGLRLQIARDSLRNP